MLLKKTNVIIRMLERPTPPVEQVILNLRKSQYSVFCYLLENSMDPALFETTKDRKRVIFSGNHMIAKTIPVLRCIFYLKGENSNEQN